MLKLFLSAALIALAAAGPAAAAGFAVNEQSVKGLGRAFSAEASHGDDASSLWYNPALSARFDRPIATFGVSGIFSNGELKNRGSTLTGPGTGGATLFVQGVNSDDPLEAGAVPVLAFAYPVRPGLTLGLNVNAPFGLTVSHPRDYFGRYDSTRTELLTANVQGSLAWRVTDKLSLGVGANAQYAEAVLESALPNLVPGAGDGALQVEGNDWSYGWNVGVAYQVSPALQLGAHYRSAIEHELDGRRRISGLVGPLAAQNASLAATAALETPGIATVGATWRATDRWTLSAQANYWEWSNFQEIRVRSDEALSDLVSEQRYDDSVSVSLGAERAMGGPWTWRGGVMLESTPTEPGFRSTRTPDADRLWVTTGGTYAPRPNVDIDASLAYVLLEETTVSREDRLYQGTPASTRFNLAAENEGNALIAAIGASVRF